MDFEQKLFTVDGEASKTINTRVIEMNDLLMDTLTKWWELSERSSGLVFPNGDGQPLTNFKKAWKELRKRGQLNGFKFKDLRSNFDSTQANNGEAHEVTQELLAHASPITTRRYYIAIESKTKQQVVDRMSARLKGLQA